MRKLFYVLSVAVLLFSAAFMTECGNVQNNEEERYDAVVKVKNSLGDEWVFDLDTEELTCKLEYTGEGVDFYVDSYNMPNDPQYGSKWISPQPGINDEFYINCYYYDPDGNWDRETDNRLAKERGTYIYYFNVDSYGEHAMHLKYRYVILNVTVE